MTIPVTDDVDPKRRATSMIGERVHTLMWRAGRTQKQLAAVLQVGQGSVSDRLRGKTEWSAIDVAVTAAWLGVPVTDLLPEMEVAAPPDPSSVPLAQQRDDDGSGVSAPSRTRTYGLRIIRAQHAA